VTGVSGAHFFMALLDPFLLSHQIEPLHFNIGGNRSPLSIRDQMVRGSIFVQRAIEQGLLDGDKSLLIIGAGVGGVTAAMTAASERVNVTLMEQEPFPFARHRNCGRWVNPTQYDWQLSHWKDGYLPFTDSPPMKLPWSRSERAHVIVGDWTTHYETFLLGAFGGYITGRFNTKFLGVIGIASDLGPAWVVYQDDQDQYRVDAFDVVLSAQGFGAEKCSLAVKHSFRGFEFWAADPFELTTLSLKQPQQKRVLISGAGDGALQDFLRIVTTKISAIEIWHALNLEKVVGVSFLDDKLRILADEDLHASRGLLWGTGERHDHPIFERIHTKYGKIVDELYAIDGVPSACDALLRRDADIIFLVYPCRHFGNVYGLNRFLSMLYIRHAKEKGLLVAYDGYRVVDVSCGHPLAADPDALVCDGELHWVTISPQADCCVSDTTGIGMSGNIDLECEIILMRHGLNTQLLVSSEDPSIEMLSRRQMLPYFNPQG
jgi:hypothetical protein